MLMGGDKKKIASVIIARMKPKGGYEEVGQKNSEAFDKMAAEPDNEKAEVTDEMVAIAEEILAAISAKDAKALAQTLSYFDEVNDKMEEGHEVESEDEEE